MTSESSAPTTTIEGRDSATGSLKTENDLDDVVIHQQWGLDGAGCPALLREVRFPASRLGLHVRPPRRGLQAMPVRLWSAPLFRAHHERPYKQKVRRFESCLPPSAGEWPNGKASNGKLDTSIQVLDSGAKKTLMGLDRRCGSVTFIIKKNSQLCDSARVRAITLRLTSTGSTPDGPTLLLPYHGASASGPQALAVGGEGRADQQQRMGGVESHWSHNPE